MDELKPVKEYLTAEVWQYEDGNVGWRIHSNCNESIDQPVAEKILLEMTEAFVAGKGNSLEFSLLVHRDGTILTRYDKNRDFTDYENWLWLRAKMHRAMWFFVQHRSSPTWRRYVYWIPSFWWHKLRGHFKPRQTKAKLRPTRRRASVTQLLSEQSEGVEITPTQAPRPPIVVPIRTPKDD